MKSLLLFLFCALFPIVLGAVSGEIASDASTVTSLNYVGLFLIVLGVSFIFIEVFVAGFGFFGIGGVLSFVSGSLLLLDENTLGYTLSVPIVIAFGFVGVIFFIVVMKLFYSSKSKKIVTGAQEMVGSVAEVVKVDAKGYQVLCHGEIWDATSSNLLVVGQEVEVTELFGLKLNVKPIKE
ncbi:MAG: hypothetical protein GW906_07620 [Epsilonproteobacteria bacterium]|nr:hypothetical protein [Campylobacterota bacterium]OIO14620.1 MAG: hypothetical protein AUJ81_09085 [Helicobacteraceae bacterium CG1_02_36_14]PIP09576.1 MAG: hypothetical protein COX50_10310 [Sulfurimonas sp. CG23_combo_of_CG06-09_8_20_14_all_36_33]PIS25305.1 MAG: hypothetical protein COT46_06415 [Sulfurimonas sp. CG08_land_8_20_14_0_20_36_33]PIU33563.1 MAG: hypothetical protein COT05_11540 [Sulfurimonas sp. CG07_land_8_20_14_0_80_36_56]PIV04032.1 MAG: hypothetical protein COS56_06030 [Sulfur